MNHETDGPNASEQAFLDQTGAFIDDLLDRVETHWPMCELRDDYCLGDRTTMHIAEFASQSNRNARALMFLSIIRAAKYRAENRALRAARDDVVKYCREEIARIENDRS